MPEYHENDCVSKLRYLKASKYSANSLLNDVKGVSAEGFIEPDMLWEWRNCELKLYFLYALSICVMCFALYTSNLKYSQVYPDNLETTTNKNKVLMYVDVDNELFTRDYITDSDFIQLQKEIQNIEQDDFKDVSMVKIKPLKLSSREELNSAITEAHNGLKAGEKFLIVGDKVYKVGNKMYLAKVLIDKNINQYFKTIITNLGVTEQNIFKIRRASIAEVPKVIKDSSKDLDFGILSCLVIVAFLHLEMFLIIRRRNTYEQSMYNQLNLKDYYGIYYYISGDLTSDSSLNSEERQQYEDMINTKPERIYAQDDMDIGNLGVYSHSDTGLETLGTDTTTKAGMSAGSEMKREDNSSDVDICRNTREYYQDGYPDGGYRRYGGGYKC